MSQVFADHLGNRRSPLFPCLACVKRRLTTSENHPNEASQGIDTKGLVLSTGSHESAAPNTTGISKRFQRASKKMCSKPEIVDAVKDLCLNVKQGELFCLLGQNGAGKSTAIAMMTGQAPLTHGSIRFVLRSPIWKSHGLVAGVLFNNCMDM